METESLKSLALKVLHGNSSGNFLETGGFQAVKIHSRILDACLWVVQGEADRAALIASENIQEPIYTADEIDKLHVQKPSPEALRRIHTVKKGFPGAIIREIKPNASETRREQVEKRHWERKNQAIRHSSVKGLFT